jgi:hypothetical protein
VTPSETCNPYILLKHYLSLLTDPIPTITRHILIMNILQPQYVPTVFDRVGDPGYVYPILICGMVFFMASNTMPMLLPEAQRIM